MLVAIELSPFDTANLLAQFSAKRSISDPKDSVIQGPTRLLVLQSVHFAL